MAWLQNLAGKAEDFLNKIDQNAANVLNEPSGSKNVDQTDYIASTAEAKLELPKCQITSVNILNEHDSPKNSKHLSSNSMQTAVLKDNASVLSEKSRTSASEAEDDGIYIDFSSDEGRRNFQFEVVQEGFLSDHLIKNETTLSLHSMHDSFHLSEDLQSNYEDRILKLELEVQDLNKQILNLQHVYSELQNENSNLQNLVDRANECVILAQNEMEQYKARAQRILQEKEKLILLQSSCDIQKDISDGDVLNTYNEELRKELEFQQEKNKELSEKITALNNEFAVLQQQYVCTQNNSQHSISSLQESLANEKKIRTIAEEECRMKTNELQSALLELSQQQSNVKSKTFELQQIKEKLKESAGLKNVDTESRLQSLTQTLMAKQHTLETITTERNALKIQMEKFENEYHRLLQNQRNEVVISNVNDTDDAKSQVPRLMVVSPFDAAVTRRVKHAYSTLDAVSIRTGVFLRRYPLARIFVFCYMVRTEDAFQLRDLDV